MIGAGATKRFRFREETLTLTLAIEGWPWTRAPHCLRQGDKGESVAKLSNNWSLPRHVLRERRTPPKRDSSSGKLGTEAEQERVNRTVQVGRGDGLASGDSLQEVTMHGGGNVPRTPRQPSMYRRWRYTARAVNYLSLLWHYEHSNTLKFWNMLLSRATEGCFLLSRSPYLYAKP